MPNLEYFVQFISAMVDREEFLLRVMLRDVVNEAAAAPTVETSNMSFAQGCKPHGLPTLRLLIYSPLRESLSFLQADLLGLWSSLSWQHRRERKWRRSRVLSHV
jgi:hypothetical protein